MNRELEKRLLNDIEGGQAFMDYWRKELDTYETLEGVYQANVEDHGDITGVGETQ